MSISISAINSDPATFFPLSPVQTRSSVPPVPETQVEDTVTLSAAAQASQLNLQGVSPTQIAEKLGISISTVDLDLGIVAATPTVPTPEAHPAARSAPASTAAVSNTAATPAVSSTAATTATTAAALPVAAAKTASV